MYENDYMYAIERSPEYLAHYGIRGMKWGVRKAIQRGDSRALGRQYAKAQKKLAKLEKQAGKSKKYARRAALMGVGAAAAGGLAAAGTGGINRALNLAGPKIGKVSGAVGQGLSGLGKGMTAASYRLPFSTKTKLAIKNAGLSVQGAGNSMKSVKGMNSVSKAVQDAGYNVGKWGNSKSISGAMVNRYASAAGKAAPAAGGKYAQTMAADAARRQAKGAIGGVTNNTIARIGAGAVGAGLAVGAARNAYKAATAQKRAAQFKSEMNKAFAGTKYANGGNRQGKKRRR